MVVLRRAVAVRLMLSGDSDLAVASYLGTLVGRLICTLKNAHRNSL